jgi:hypothetical protein
MAWIEKKKRNDGGVSARVVWRLGGSRDGAYQSETFSAGTDAMNMERARGFKSMVDARVSAGPTAESVVRGLSGRTGSIRCGGRRGSKVLEDRGACHRRHLGCADVVP